MPSAISLAALPTLLSAYYDDLGFSIDISRMRFPEWVFRKDEAKDRRGPLRHGYASVEKGGYRQSGRKTGMVGHYWLR